MPLFLAWSGATAHPALRRHGGAINREIGSEAATVIDGATGAVLSTSGIAAYERLDLTSAVAFFLAHADSTGGTRRDLALLKGYALLQLDDPEAARAIFEGLYRDLATEDTRQALRSLE